MAHAPLQKGQSVSVIEALLLRFTAAGRRPIWPLQAAAGESSHSSGFFGGFELASAVTLLRCPLVYADSKKGLFMLRAQSGDLGRDIMFYLLDFWAYCVFF